MAAHHLANTGADPRVAALVAYHSAARSETAELGLAHELDPFPDEQSLVRGLLWFCDMAIGPDGLPMTFDQRMTDVRQRYGPDQYVCHPRPRRGMTDRAAAITRAEAWIADNDIHL